MLVRAAVRFSNVLCLAQSTFAPLKPDRQQRVACGPLLDGDERLLRSADIRIGLTNWRYRPGTDIQRARRERSFISMETTGPTLRHNLAANGPSSSPWQRRGTFGRQS
jgi:hypothetical protein